MLASQLDRWGGEGRIAMSEYSHGHQTGEIWGTHRATSGEYSALKARFDSMSLNGQNELYLTFPGDKFRADETLVFFIRPATKDDHVLAQCFWEELLGEDCRFQFHSEFLRGFVWGALASPKPTA